MVKKIIENKNELIGIGIVSILLCMIFSYLVSDWVYMNVVKYHQISVSVNSSLEDGENNPRLLDNMYEENFDGITNAIDSKLYGFYNFEQLKDSVIDSQDVKVVEADESEYGYGYIEFMSADSYLILELPVYPNTCLTFTDENNSFGISINDKEIGFERVIGALEQTYSTLSTLKIYLYNEKGCVYIYIYTIFAYVILFISFGCIILIICKMFSFLLCGNNFLNGECNPPKMFLIIFLSYVAFTAITYKMNSEKFLVGPGSDAYYYMNPLAWDENGNFSLEVMANYLYSFRGYLSILPALCFNPIASLLGIDVMYLYFILYGIIVAFTMSVALPKLFESLTDRKAANIMCLFAYILFSLFWVNFYFYALTDIPSAMAAMCGLAYLFDYLKNNKYSKVFLSGLFIGIAIGYRSAYSYVFYMMLIWLIIRLAINIYKKEIHVNQLFKCVLMMTCGMVLILLPQFVLNIERGHIGIFPYDGGCLYDMNALNVVGFTWADFTGGMHSYGYGTTTQNGDLQLAQIDQYYYMDKYYTFKDLLYLVLSNPLNFFMGYFKRLFWAMSIGVVSAYSGLSFPKWWSTSVSLVYYVLLGNVINLFINKKLDKYFNITGRKLCIFLAVVTIVIQNMCHIEKRYFMVFQLFIFFLNAFIVMDYCKDMVKDNRKISLKYIFTMLIFVCGCYTLKQTIYYNFL